MENFLMPQTASPEWFSKTNMFPILEPHIGRRMDRTPKTLVLFWDRNRTPYQANVQFAQMSGFSSHMAYVFFSLLKKDFIYLFLHRREGWEKERERNINVWLPLTWPHWGPGLQPRHVPCLGIKAETLWFTGRCSISWAAPARAGLCFLDPSQSLTNSFHHVLIAVSQMGDTQRNLERRQEFQMCPL